MAVAIDEVGLRPSQPSGHISTSMSGRDWMRVSDLLAYILVGEPTEGLEVSRHDLFPHMAIHEYLLEHPGLLTADETRRLRYNRLTQRIAEACKSST